MLCELAVSGLAQDPVAAFGKTVQPHELRSAKVSRSGRMGLL